MSFPFGFISARCWLHTPHAVPLTFESAVPRSGLASHGLLGNHLPLPNLVPRPKKTTTRARAANAPNASPLTQRKKVSLSSITGQLMRCIVVCVDAACAFASEVISVDQMEPHELEREREAESGEREAMHLQWCCDEPRHIIMRYCSKCKRVREREQKRSSA